MKIINKHQQQANNNGAWLDQVKYNYTVLLILNDNHVEPILPLLFQTGPRRLVIK